MAGPVQDTKKSEITSDKNSKQIENLVEKAKEAYSKMDTDKNGSVSLNELKNIVMPIAKSGVEQIKEFVELSKSSERRDWSGFLLEGSDRAHLSSNRIDLSDPKQLSEFPRLNALENNEKYSEDLKLLKLSEERSAKKDQ